MLNVFIVFSLFEKMDLLSSKSKKQARLLGQGYRAQGFPDGSVVKIPPANAGATRDVGSIPGLKKFPGGENGKPTPVFLPGEPHGQGGWQATARGATKSQTQDSNIMGYTPRRQKPNEGKCKSIEELSLSAPNTCGFRLGDSHATCRNSPSEVTQ